MSIKTMEIRWRFDGHSTELHGRIKGGKTDHHWSTNERKNVDVLRVHKYVFGCSILPCTNETILLRDKKCKIAFGYF